MSSSGPGRTLSAHDYRAGRSCPAKLFFRKNGHGEKRDADPYGGLLTDGLFMVKALARARHPDAIDINPGLSVADAAMATLGALAPFSTVANATVMAGRRWARVDLIERRGNVARLIDVRSTAFDGAAHAESLARGGKGILRAKRKPWPLIAAWAPLIEGLAFKAACLRGMIPGIQVECCLTLVDKSRVARVDNVPSFFTVVRRGSSFGGQFNGGEKDLAELDLLSEVDCTDEVEMVMPLVEAASEFLEYHLDSDLDAILAEGVVRGARCGKCEYFSETDPGSGHHLCWGALGSASPHVLELFSAGTLTSPTGEPLVEWMFQRGKASLFDVPMDRLVTRDGIPGANNIRQLRQIEQTQIGRPFVGPGLRGAIDSLVYPLHFVDFEASRLALPYHRGMHPYGVVAFQWSCHTVDRPGAEPRHAEWLNADDIWPNENFAESLRAQVGNVGSVLTWSQFERGTLGDIAGELRAANRGSADLLRWLDAVGARIIDLEAWAKLHYYHPGMRGSTSIKVVLDALWRTDDDTRARYTRRTGRSADRDVDPYHSLPSMQIGGVDHEVREGTGAIRAYQAMMYGPDRDPQARDAWSKLLRDYCALDTLAMLLVFEHWESVP